MSTFKKLLSLTSIFILSSLMMFSNTIFASDDLIDRSIQLSNSSSGVTAIYDINFSVADTSTPVALFTVQFCSNSPNELDVCDFPVGLDTTNAVLVSQTGNTGFTLDNSTNGTLSFSRNPSVPGGIANSYQVSNIVNPSDNGQYYARIKTFATNDINGPEVEGGGIAMRILPDISVGTYVPPYITFCVAVSIPEFNCGSGVGDQINFGDFQSYSSAASSLNLLVATNAENGYNITVNGTTLTSGNYIIPALTNPSPPQYGNSQFGMNLVANTQPRIGSNVSGDPVSQPSANYGYSNLFTFNDGDIIAQSNQPSNYTRFVDSFMVNVNKNQEPGVYSTTLTYIASANY
jgi:hypothetical protein